MIYYDNDSISKYKEKKSKKNYVQTEFKFFCLIRYWKCFKKATCF